MGTNAMNQEPSCLGAAEAQRRALLQAAAGLAVGHIGINVAAATDAIKAQSGPKAQGSIGDFNFLAGEWRINHRRLKAPGEWDEFKGEATC
jgi:hypothetical protein